MSKRLSTSTLSEALRSDRFLNSCQNAVRPSQLTAPHTQAAMAEMLRVLAPANVLEIGTFFADTARYLAQVLSEVGGHLVTIDPFGGHLVPGIIAGWPAALQEHVTFRPDNSMTFFHDIENSRAAPFDVAFIDGDHSFDYALFDLMRSARFLRPGGALVLDNVEQAGPSEAVRFFMQRYTHWRLFKFTEDDDRLDFTPGTNAAIILSPIGIEITTVPYKFNLSDLTISQIGQLRLRAKRSASGLLKATSNLYSIPPDHHLTGTGAQSSVGTSLTAVQSAGTTF